MSSPCVVRKACRGDIPPIKALVDEDGWDEYDLDFLYCMFDLDQRGWFVAETESGEIIGRDKGPPAWERQLCIN